MADGISFSGLGSGIDFGQIKDAILAERMRPVNQLQNKSSLLGKKSESLKQLNGLLAGLTTAAEALTNRELGDGRVASSGDTGVVIATATNEAVTGGLEVDVVRLATRFTQATAAGKYSAEDAVVVSDTTRAATFELRKGGAPTGTVITLDPNDPTSPKKTLKDLRDEINKANAGVTAAIVEVSGSGTAKDYQLVLTSTANGTAGKVELVETTAGGSNTNLGALQTLSVANLDAEVKVNGLTITRSTNSIADAVTGLTLNLKKVGATTVSIGASSEVTDKLQSFVQAYNGVQDFIAAQYRKDGSGRPTGLLAGDPTLRGVQRQLREAVGASSTTNGGQFTSLAEIGLTTQSDGKLKLDTAMLDGKLKDYLGDVKALLAGKTTNETGLAQALHNSYDGLSDSITGAVQTAINGYQSSIKSLDRSINDQLQRINTLRGTLTRQMAAADAAIGQLNGQGTALTNVIKSLEPRK